MDKLQKTASSATFYLSQISKNLIDPKQLTRHQRRICVRYLLNDRKHTQQEIAAILGVAESQISRDKRRIMEQNAWMAENIDERQVAVELARAGEAATARLFRKGKEKEAFEVQAKTIDVLQSLGYLKRAPVELKGLLSIQEILKLAIDPKDEIALLGNTGRGSPAPHTNGSG